MSKFKKYFMPGLMIVSAIAVLIIAIVVRQTFWTIIPILVSLTIGLMQSRASRLAPLIGGLNSIIYAGVYIYQGLYGMCVYALLVSFPIQLVTFFLWRKNAWKGSTIFRKMKGKTRLVLAVGFVAAVALVQFVLMQLNSDYAFLDSACTMLGMACTLLTMFAYIEYTWLMIINSFINVVLYGVMAATAPQQGITYLIYASYLLICQVVAFFEVRKIYKQQQQ